MAIAIATTTLKKIIRHSPPLISSSAPSSCSITAAYPIGYYKTPAPPPAAAAATEPTERPVLLKVDDVKEIFWSVGTWKLVRSLINLQVASMQPMVDMGIKVIKSREMENKNLIDQMVSGAFKHTFYEHFCAGEDPAAAGRVASKLWKYKGMRGMLDYGLEHALDSVSCDHNLVCFLQTVESTKSLPTNCVSYVIVKVTAICPLSLLERVSHQLRWEYQDKSCDLPWKMNCLPIFSASSPLYHTPTKPDPLTAEEEAELNLAMERLRTICRKCLQTGVPLVVDAEDTLVQPAIDYFVYSAAIEYNKDENPVVFGTIQAYLKDAKERLFNTSMAAEKMGIPMGFKLVRGAYMSSENQKADTLGVESPVHNTIENTHACFNECALFLIGKIAAGDPGKVVLATHNVESGRLAVTAARALGIDNMTDKIQFAQLYGMAEGFSYGLKEAGFQVSKYMPFGPVNQIMPYLIRRAEENNTLLSSSTHDRRIMRVELMRRMKATIL